MDYIKEQLLRQRNVLAALMNGGSRNAAETGETAERDMLRRDRPEDIVLPARETAAGGAVAEGVSVRRRETARGAVPAARMAAAVEWPVTAERGETMHIYGAGHGGGMDAQAVSRAIERDARRYDGGFSLY